jgi:hypothetical protein
MRRRFEGRKVDDSRRFEAWIGFCRQGSSDLEHAAGVLMVKTSVGLKGA